MSAAQIGLAAPQSLAGRGAPLAFVTLMALIVSLQFGPFIGLVGFTLTGDGSWTLVGAARDALVLLLLLLAGLSLLSQPVVWQLPRSARWALLLVAVYSVFALLSDEPLIVVGLNLRRLALVPLLFAALLVLPWSRRQLELLMATVLLTSLAVALFGLFERFGPDALWTQVLNVVAYTSANPLDPWGALEFEANGRYFSWDLLPLTGEAYRRLISTNLEPTTLAPTLAMALVLTLALRARRAQGAWPDAAVRIGCWPGLPLLFVVVGLLTISKGFALFLVMLLLWRWVGLPQPWQVLTITLAGVGMAVLLVEAGYTDGPFAHADGLASAIEYLLQGHLLGEGLGAAGNYTVADSDVGAESGLGNGLAQVGIAAFLPLLWVRAIALDLRATAWRRRDPAGLWLGTWLLFWFLTYLLSASSLGVGGNALGFAVLALYLHPAWAPAAGAPTGPSR